ncbi:peptidylprolyl isomerase [Occallatibacter savannae]|uniref:peptidylprolyl isomerase n=1 Tax=Occallatibacter savannae TaxID=1002691 RepID=UPI000D69F35E|nr:peptidylprolyl isomerase [Occallatibacter savannae]
MTLKILRVPGALALSAVLFTGLALAQQRPSSTESPYGGSTVEEIVARVNNQIITKSDYDRAQNELDQEMRQRGSTMQEISDAHRDLLRNLIDQQLWLAKGKELGVTGDTELINRLNEIRKQYNLATMEDLEKAAKDQGVSFEDFKANIRNQIVTQSVMRDQVGRKIQPTPGELQRYFEAHKSEYAQPESVKLGEILISTGSNPDDQQKLAEAKAKADDIEARLKAGGDFAQLARSFSEGTTAATGGELGTYKKGQLGEPFESKTFGLKTGEITEPIRTKQGYVILKVLDHIQGGDPQFKDVQNEVEQNYFEAKAGPAMRQYLAQMRDEAAIYIKPGYEDSAATAAEKHPSITFSAYQAPTAKKKRKVERTRFRETTHGFRQKTAVKPLPSDTASADAAAPAKPEKASKKNKKAKTEEASMKPGKKEKIRFGKAPQETLPAAPASPTEDAGAVGQVAAGNEPENPLEADSKPEKKTRFSDRAKLPKQPKPKGPQLDPEAPTAADAAEVADRQAQAGPLGLGGNQTDKKKKKNTTTGDKTRLSDKKKDQQQEDTGDRPLGLAPQQPVNGTTPAPPIPGTPGVPPQ